MPLEETLSPYDRFIESLENSFTRHQYEHFFKKFTTFAKVSPEDLVKSSPMAIEDAIKRHINALENEGMSYGTRAAVVNAVRKFLRVNKVKDIDWDEIRKRLGEDESDHDDQPYSIEIIRKLFGVCDLRKKVIVGILATSGIRRGALAPLKLKHATKLKIPGSSAETYALEIYANSKKDRYTTFITPEVSALLDEYLKTRTAAGEELTPDSPLIREQFNRENAKNPRHITTSTSAQLVTSLIIQAGLKNEIRQKKIHEMHAFRKRVYTELIKAGVKEINVKRIIGHSTGLGRNYDRQEFTDLLNDYAKAIPALTISNEPEMQRKIEVLEAEKNEIQAIKKELLKARLEIEHLKEDREKTSQLFIRSSVKTGLEALEEEEKERKKKELGQKTLQN